MSFVRGGDLRRSSIRVALAATGLVGLVYLAVAVGVVAFVTTNLTAQVDQRLADAVDRSPGRGGPGGPRPGGGPGPSEPFEPGETDRRFGPEVLVWTVLPNDTILAATRNPDLPEDLHGLRGSTTATMDGIDFRLYGTSYGRANVVVGQDLDSVQSARSTIILAELAIAPILLSIVFFGAVAIGRRAAAPIEQARRRQLEFTADASHELRTPLSVIEANTQLALSSDRTAEWYREAFERVGRESGRMRRLVEDLLWLARFDDAQGPPNAEPVDVAILAARTADRFGAVAEARGLRLSVSSTADDAVVTLPPEWLDRLLGVLLDNACKYSPDGGAVDVTVARDGPRVSLTVDDAGPGIPEAERDRIFDRFHRATEAKSGAGLGLAIANAVVAATGGRWRVGESPAGGARMSVSWPRAFGDPRQPAGSARAAELRTAPGDPTAPPA